MSELHNALTRSGALIAGVRRMVGGGEEVAVERLGETLTPVLDPWSKPEFAFLRGERLLWRPSGTIAAGAVQRSQVQLLNPADSGLLVVIERIDTTIGVDWELVFNTAALATLIGVGLRRDNRIGGGNGGGVAQLRSATAAFDATAISVYRVRGGTTFIDLPVVLTPGSAIIATPQADNTAMLASFAWRERWALPGELD